MGSGRIRRLVSLARMLRAGTPIDADILAADLAVSRRTVFRDLHALREAGFVSGEARFSDHGENKHTEDSSKSRTVRLLTILKLIDDGHLVDADALAAQLSVSRRTIFRDLNALESAGVVVPSTDTEKSSRANSCTSQQLFIEIEAPPGATDEEIEQLLAEAASRASALHIAHGGSGLTVAEDADVQVWSPVPVPVGGPT